VSAPQKPRDVGNGLVCASFGRSGEWLSLASVDPKAGFVELTGLPLFDPELRSDVDAVRRFRSWMRREEHAFLRLEAGLATIRTRQDAPRGTRGVVQRLVIEAPRRLRPSGVGLRIHGRLARPTLAEISEVEPPTRPASDGASDVAPKSRFKAREGTLWVSGEGGPVIVQAWLRQGGSAPEGSAEGRSDIRLHWQVLRRRVPTATAWVDWPDDAEKLHLDIACTFDGPVADAPDWLPGTRISPRPRDETRQQPRPLFVPTKLVRTIGRLNQRAASYTRTCTALQVEGGQRCILTDHRILPLSWTRDAYWQARLLLATWARGGHDVDARIVADHLRWLFLRCQRPDGRWVRSHYADGRRKDHPFQADQQLYPLLELADYLAVTSSLPELPSGQAWGHLAAEAWAAAESAIDGETGLIRTEENPADDVATHPFIVSDQILLWHVASRLADAASRLDLDRESLLARARRSRSAVEAHFVIDGPLGRQWAYAVDGRGSAERYMDANDLPVGLAPLWGFCKPGDRTWQATMRFAFDERNPGFVPGVVGGLGSRHTPGTWTLGDIMGWVAFGLMGERAASEAALQRLVGAAFGDGMLPEAYDPDGTGSAVRHWFAWPGAALGVLVLEHAARA